MKRVVTSAHVHAQTKTSFRYEATWHIEGVMLIWKASVTLPGRRWSLAGGTPEWTDGGEAKAVRDDVGRSIDGLQVP
jgi:hypothetical protein